MPTKRRRIDRRRKAQVTREAVALFVQCEALYPIRNAHFMRECGSDGRCGECQAYLDAKLKLNDLLGIEPWMRDIEEVDTAEPPGDLDPLRAKAWRRTWQLRCALEAEVERAR